MKKLELHFTEDTGGLYYTEQNIWKAMHEEGWKAMHEEKNIFIDAFVGVTWLNINTFLPAWFFFYISSDYNPAVWVYLGCKMLQ